MRRRRPDPLFPGTALSSYAVVDFETTGMTPELGARPTEIAVVLVRDGAVVDRYQSLMNADAWIPPQIQALTGISNAMVKAAPRVERVMAEAADFVGNLPLVAHNAAFDRKFWDAELSALGRSRAGDFVCSLMLARRLFPDAPNHKLGTLVRALGLPATGRYHRALADAEATAYLFLRIADELRQRYRLAQVEHELLMRIQQTARSGLARCIARHVAQRG